MAYVRDDPIAITIPLIADAPAYDDQPLGMTNLQWCERELARIHAKGDTQPRLVTVGRRCWITRAKAKARCAARKKGSGRGALTRRTAWNAAGQTPAAHKETP